MAPLIDLRHIAAELALTLKLRRNLQSSLRVNDIGKTAVRAFYQSEGDFRQQIKDSCQRAKKEASDLWDLLGIVNKKQCENKIQQLREFEYDLWPELEKAKIQAGII